MTTPATHTRGGPLFADLVVTDANVITVDKSLPRAQAFAVRDGRFIAVGANTDVEPFIGAGTTVISARGKTIVPGFNDAHLHPRTLYPWDHRLGMVDLRPESVAGMDALVAALKAKAAITPKGAWVMGNRYQDTKLGRSPTRHDLDRVSTEHPVWIGHSSGHIGVVNSYALRAAGITRDTPDPSAAAAGAAGGESDADYTTGASGTFGRDADGEPNGICYEAASKIVREGGPPLPQPTPEEEREGYRRCFAEFMANGITSVGDASTTPRTMRVYQDLAAAGMPLRINMMIRDAHFAELQRLNLRTGFGDHRLRIGPVKVFHGNSLSGRTCWLYEPYDMVNPATGLKDYHGIPPGRTQDELNAHFTAINRAGCQIAVHANGDREIDMVLEAIATALRDTPRADHRHRIEHASVANERILRRVRELGIVLALHSYIYEHGETMEAYGAWRWPWMHPNRKAIDLGIVVAGNSDYGVSAARPLLRIQSLVTRTSSAGKAFAPEQALGVDEALWTWTMGGAYASHEERIKGSITPGKLADFVILTADPRTVPPDTIKDIVVEQTFIDGVVAYDRSTAASRN
jgi:hypothetical protein